MIAGRLHWPGKKTRSTLALFEFDDGTLSLTEAGSKRRASLHLVQGEAALRAMDPGGLEVLEADLAQFASRLKSENHTLKRALTDPRLFAGIGNAYSDEILHRAKLSPIALTQGSDRRGGRAPVPFDARRCSSEWTQAPAQRGRSPRRSPRSARRWRCTAASASPARCAARRCSASSTPRTRPTTARAARPAADPRRPRAVAPAQEELAALDRRTTVTTSGVNGCGSPDPDS